MTRTFTNVALLGSIATLFFTGPAWAYLDPGTGSMMLQLLLGGIAGAMVAGRLYWHRFREFVTSRFSAKPGKITQAGHVNASARTNAPDE
jgi:hypothetical protein